MPSAEEDRHESRLHRIGQLLQEFKGNLGDTKITESRNPNACIKRRENDQRTKLYRVEDL